MALKTNYPTSSPWPPSELANDLNENFAKLAEVSLSTSPTDGSLLVYNASAELFEDQVVTYTLGELTTVALSTTPNDGDVLTYDASSDTWVDAAINVPTALSDLTSALGDIDDVVLSTNPNDGSALVYDASSDTWVDGEAAGGDPELNSQTGTSYTLVIGDAYDTVSMDNASANTLTIPTNASVAFDTGTVIAVLQEGAGTTTVSGDTGVTVNGTSGGSEDIGTQYASAALVKVGTDEWVVAVGSGSGGGGSSTLDGLTDVVLSTSPTDRAMLEYDASSDTWVDTAFTTEGTAKAWVNYNGSSSTVTSSYNCSSVTDIATGNFAVNLSNSFADADYNAATAGTETNSNTTVVVVGYDSASSSSSTADFWSISTSAGAAGFTNQMATLLGDLA